MDVLQRILKAEAQSKEVRLHEDKEEFEYQVQGLVDLYDFIEKHPDDATKKVLKFMPPVDTQVLAEAVRRIRLRDEKGFGSLKKSK